MLLGERNLTDEPSYCRISFEGRNARRRPFGRFRPGSRTVKTKRTSNAVQPSAGQHVRVARASRVLVEGYGNIAVTHAPVDAVANLLCDLRLFCDERGLYFSQIDDNAYERYLQEVIG
jgi:hypothetical protein